MRGRKRRGRQAQRLANPKIETIKIKIHSLHALSSNKKPQKQNVFHLKCRRKCLKLPQSSPFPAANGSGARPRPLPQLPASAAHRRAEPNLFCPKREAHTREKRMCRERARWRRLWGGADQPEEEGSSAGHRARAGGGGIMVG